MASDLRLVPSTCYPRVHLHSAGFSAPSAPGIHDTLRFATSSTSIASSSSISKPSYHPSAPPAALTSRHPLEARLNQWTKTQETLNYAILRREFGLAAPLTRQMDLLTVRQGEWGSMAGFMDGLGGARGSGVHEDILLGRDAEISWEDIYRGDELGMMGMGADFHGEMERRLGMDW